MSVVCPHEGLPRELIGRWKFAPAPALSRSLGHLLEEALGGLSDGPSHDLIVPVPQSGTAWTTRAFSPVNDLAHAMSAVTCIPVCHALLRGRHTRPQVGLTAPERRRNVLRLFRPTRRGRVLVPGRRLLLVDDVVTSQATASACCGALLGAGARAVDVIALARAATS